MRGTTWFSIKHNAWAVVTDEPVTERGYYTIEFPNLGIYRRYNAQRIAREIAEQSKGIDLQLAERLGYTAPVSELTRREIDVRLPDDAKTILNVLGAKRSGAPVSLDLDGIISDVKGCFASPVKGKKLVGVLFLFEE